MHGRQVIVPDGRDPYVEVLAVAPGEQGGERAYPGSQGGQLRAAGDQVVEVPPPMIGQVLGPAHEPAGQAARGRRGACGVSASLVEVAHQQGGAARIALLADLGQQQGDCHGGLGGEAAAQVLAVGVDQGAAVLRGTLQGLGRAGPGVACDGVQRPAQAPRALQQPDALREQGVDGGVPVCGCAPPE